MDKTLSYIRKAFGDIDAKIGVVLGSGLNFLVDEKFEKTISIPYSEIPGFVDSTVEGHCGRLISAELNGKAVICMQGRFHYYEGYTMKELTYPVRVLAELGVESLILTNAAGGIDESYVPGTLMLISDHINFLGNNPLIGYSPIGNQVRFPDMTKGYSSAMRLLAKDVAVELGLDLKEGVYLATTGPSFETPAEIKTFRLMGANAVGMSTVPEAIVANQCGMSVCGISCITNMAAGMTGEPLTHEEVTETANRVKNEFANLVSGICGRL